MKLHLKDWVCTISEEELEKRRTAQRERAGGADWWSGVLRNKLWRQISIVATADTISLSLMNVDAEAAAGGCWSGGEACVDHRFTWDDLFDKEFVERLLCRESVLTFRKVETMLNALKDRVVPLREALAAA